MLRPNSVRSQLSWLSHLRSPSEITLDIRLVRYLTVAVLLTIIALTACTEETQETVVLPVRESPTGRLIESRTRVSHPWRYLKAERPRSIASKRKQADDGRLILSFERQAKGELTVHRHDGVEVKTDMVIDSSHASRPKSPGARRARGKSPL